MYPPGVPSYWRSKSLSVVQLFSVEAGDRSSPRKLTGNTIPVGAEDGRDHGSSLEAKRDGQLSSDALREEISRRPETSLLDACQEKQPPPAATVGRVLLLWYQ